MSGSEQSSQEGVDFESAISSGSVSSAHSQTYFTLATATVYLSAGLKLHYCNANLTLLRHQ